MSFSKHYRQNLCPIHFHTPTKGCKVIRDVVYGRKVECVEDKEDAVCAITEVVEQAMETAFHMGLTLGIEYGRESKLIKDFP
tara:strand:- start:152 stop:397 length:246 start_codon:yes stop_codon:yes gene_type:complete